MDVLPVAEARAGLSRLIADFRVNDDLAVVIGAHRRPEAALVSYARYRELTSAKPAVDLARLRELRSVIARLAAASNLADVAVYGSVARGEQRPGSDVDLLVTPNPGATLFDMAQLELDLELILGVPVSATSRGALDPERDALIIAQAVPL